ncbi:hypothetical protein C9374_014547 [Naegleria lovaniensis]|uniref:Uncharacterized protein n=1 Tax=Naegleria lovaniensis TaxID=51637 RepID=A0AA88GY09_NAELO|nr:uncharacterized protein C9374_014547 [Naegleria lovaniensis]KAG2389147.1 hypothetical protein C9374_014547 [Naegleria lovaniensis]
MRKTPSTTASKLLPTTLTSSSVHNNNSKVGSGINHQISSRNDSWEGNTSKQNSNLDLQTSSLNPVTGTDDVVGSYSSHRAFEPQLFNPSSTPIKPSPNSSMMDLNILSNVGSSKVDLSEELTSQIEYNNSLLKELQSMERRVQDLNRDLSQKDHDLRQATQERFNVQKMLEKVQSDLYNTKLHADRLEHENVIMTDQIEKSKKTQQSIASENKDLLDKLEISSQQLADRNEELKSYQHENSDLHEKINKMELDLSELQYKLDEALHHLNEEKHQSLEFQKQHEQERNDLFNEINRLTEDIEKLKYELNMSDKERDQILFNKEETEKRVYELEAFIESSSLQWSDKLKQSHEEYDRLMKEHKKLESDYSALKTSHYQYLGDVRKELREICNSVVMTKDQSNKMIQEISETQTFCKTLLSTENSTTEALVNEIKSLLETKSRCIAELQNAADYSRSVELQLEEEKSKSIMFEERTSKFEQQVQEIQQKSKQTEREMAIKHAQQIERTNLEVESVRNNMRRLEEENSNLRKSQQSLQKMKSDMEENERKTLKENRVLTESIRKLQRQLEETKRYLSIVQADRNNVYNEKEDLRRELHDVLNTQRNSAIVDREPFKSSVDMILQPIPSISNTLPNNNPTALSGQASISPPFNASQDYTTIYNSIPDDRYSNTRPNQQKPDDTSVLLEETSHHYTTGDMASHQDMIQQEGRLSSHLQPAFYQELAVLDSRTSEYNSSHIPNMLQSSFSGGHSLIPSTTPNRSLRMSNRYYDSLSSQEQ